jgi:hypothetical protein
LAGQALSKAGKAIGKAKSTAAQAGKKAKQLLSPNGLMRQARNTSARSASKAFAMRQRKGTTPSGKSSPKDLHQRQLRNDTVETVKPGSRPVDSKLQLEGWELGSEALLKAAGLRELIDVPGLQSSDLSDSQANAIRNALQQATVGNANNIPQAASAFVLTPTGQLSKADTHKALSGLPSGSTVITTNEAGAKTLQGKSALGLEPGAFAFEVAGALEKLFGAAKDQDGGPAAQCERVP